jgi:lysozyme
MVPQAAIDLARHFEGFSSKPYICPAGFWTIGHGHLCKPDHPPITKAQAEAYLIADLNLALRSVLRLCPVMATESSGRLAAIVDFTFNLGAGRLHTSTLRRCINSGNWDRVPHELRRWVRGGGRVLPGLVRRREAEVALI